MKGLGSKVDYFSSESLREDLKGKTVRGGMATGVGQVVQLLISLVSIPILARLLAPDDFGLVAMVTFFTGFAGMFVDAGLSMATVQREEITRQQVSNLFWLATLLGAIIAIVVMLCAPLISWVYGEPRLTAIARALAISFIFSGLTLQHLALMRRGMQFSRIAVLGIVSILIGQFVGILWAWVYYQQPQDYWALIFIPITSAVSRMIMAWLLCGWRPGLPKSCAGTREMVGIGANLTMANFVNYFGRNADNMLIGWWWGADMLGYYERAYRLLLFPLRAINGPIGNIAVPALSRLKSNPPAYRAYFRRGLQLSTAVFLPVVVAATVLAEPLVLTVLTPEWREAVPIFIALCPAAIASATGPATTWVYQSWGHTDQFFRIVLLTTACLLIGFVASVPFGTVAVAWTFSAISCLLRIPSISLAFKPTPLTLRDFFQPMIPSALASALAAIAVLIFTPWTGQIESYFVQLTVGFALFAAVYIAPFLLSSSGRSVITQLLGHATRQKKGAP